MTYFIGPGDMAPLAPRSATGTHTPKYLDQFLMVLHATFIKGLIFVRQSQQGPATLWISQISCWVLVTEAIY